MQFGCASANSEANERLRLARAIKAARLEGRVPLSRPASLIFALPT
jgi:hypothetical protein